MPRQLFKVSRQINPTATNCKEDIGKLKIEKIILLVDKQGIKTLKNFAKATATAAIVPV